MKENKLSSIVINDSFKNLSDVNITFLLRRDNFSPTIEWAKEKITLSLQSIGNRYVTYNKKQYEDLNQKVSIQDYFDYVEIDDTYEISNYIQQIKESGSYGYLEQRYIQVSTRFASFKNKDKNSINVLRELEMISKVDDFFDKYDEFVNIIFSFRNTLNQLFNILNKITLNKAYAFSHELIEVLENLEQNTNILKSSKFSEANKFLDAYDSDYAIQNISNSREYISLISSYFIVPLIYFLRDRKFDTSLSRNNINEDNKFSTYLFKHTLIVGEAMSGKTHMLSDIAKNRIDNNKPTVLIYGQKFNNTDRPIQQIIKQLHLEQYQYTDKDFLELLNEWGKKSNELVFLIVDAINETPDKSVWRNHFIEFVSMVKKYPYISLIMSIRDVEKRVIFTQDIENYVKSNMIEVEHPGFKEIEYPVLKKFCKVFDVNLPKFPLTSSIFTNPGLMFLFFEILQRKKIVDIDERVLKPNFIIEEYIKDRNKHFKERNNIVDRGAYIHKGTNVVASKIVSTEFIEKVKYDDISSGVAQIHSQLLEYLISEGILLEQLGSLDEAYLYFSYQRFGNYFIALYLLSGQFTKENLPNEDIIYDLFSNYEEHQALIEALIIRLSENNKLDFMDIFPELFDEGLSSIRNKCFAKSLKLPDSIEYKLSHFIIINMEERGEILDLLLGFALEKLSQFNIKKNLHPLLLSLSMNKRDYYWSLYIHESFSNEGIVEKIIDWAWNKKEEFEIEDESLYLYGLTLGWFLTSSNRELRDGATKALVNLFTDRVDVFLSVLKEFETVDDLYVLERLYAVGYGIVLRSSKYDGYIELGQYLYETIFNQSEVIEHSFIRDYTRLTIEYISKKYELEIDKSKIEPPYNKHYHWDISSIGKDDIEYTKDDYRRIYNSTIYGDFKIYIVYPLLNRFMNLKIKDRPHPKMPSIRYDEFFEALTEKQQEEYEKIKQESHHILSVLQEIDKDQTAINDTLVGIKEEQLTFRNMLSVEQLKEYDDFIVTYRQAGRYENGINVKDVKWLIFLEAVKLGWDKELFEEFDKDANNGRGRETGTERIGKKYQWIALYKVLSRLSDNYEFREDSYGEKITVYGGMYQFAHNRDIDPSTILKSKQDTVDEQYFGIDTVFENLELSDKEWMNSTDKLPTLNQLVNVKNNDRESLALHLSFSKDGTKTEKNYRNLYYNIDAFVIRKDCITGFMEWLGTVNYYGQSKLPQSSSLHNMYLREYPNSEAFNHLDIPYYGQVDWEDSFGHSGESMPCKILLTSTSYMNEGQSYDKSVEETIEVLLPHKWFVNEMDLKQTLVDGEWMNRQGEIVFSDPTVKTGNLSPYNENGTLVADKKLLTEFLEAKDYGLVWVMWGEKQVRSTGEGFNDEDFLGIAEISGYGYFKGNEWVENIDISWNERN